MRSSKKGKLPEHAHNCVSEQGRGSAVVVSGTGTKATSTVEEKREKKRKARKLMERQVTCIKLRLQSVLVYECGVVLLLVFR